MRKIYEILDDPANKALWCLALVLPLILIDNPVGSGLVLFILIVAAPIVIYLFFRSNAWIIAASVSEIFCLALVLSDWLPVELVGFGFGLTFIIAYILVLFFFEPKEELLAGI